jgi:hypothetical protein
MLNVIHLENIGAEDVVQWYSTDVTDKAIIWI